MDISAIDKALQAIIKTRNELSKIDYNNPKYDDLEEKLHDLEDDFQEEYGDFMEEILQDVHDEYCPDSDVLLPIAYLATQYTVNASNEYSVGLTEGVFVEMDDYPGKETKLVILPNPVRIVLNIGRDQQKIVWTAAK